MLRQGTLAAVCIVTSHFRQKNFTQSLALTALSNKNHIPSPMSTPWLWPCCEKTLRTRLVIWSKNPSFPLLAWGSRPFWQAWRVNKVNTKQTACSQQAHTHTYTTWERGVVKEIAQAGLCLARKPVFYRCSPAGGVLQLGLTQGLASVPGHLTDLSILRTSPTHSVAGVERQTVKLDLQH